MVNFPIDYIGENYHNPLETELNQKIERRVIEHRNRFRRLIFNRYAEFLPLMINYTRKEETGIDFLQLEVMLHHGYQVVVGRARNQRIMVLGYVRDYKNQYYNITNIADFTNYRRRKKKDI